MTTILTLELDENSLAHFEAMRREYFPPHLNQIPAHLTLFHQLPSLHEIVDVLTRAADRPAFPLKVTGLRSLGKGVAYTLASTELQLLHTDLALEFAPLLTRQDSQRFQPHIVVQNKVTPDKARSLLAQLQAGFKPFAAQAAGLNLWNYLGGPWEHAASFRFR